MSSIHYSTCILRRACLVFFIMVSNKTTLRISALCVEAGLTLVSICVNLHRQPDHFASYALKKRCMMPIMIDPSC